MRFFALKAMICPIRDLRVCVVAFLVSEAPFRVAVTNLERLSPVNKHQDSHSVLLPAHLSRHPLLLPSGAVKLLQHAGTFK